MYIQPAPYTQSITSSNTIPTMHPILSTTSTNNTIRLSHEHRTRLYQIVNELTDDQLRMFLTNHIQSISNTTLNNQFQHYSRTQLIQQTYILIDNYYSIDLEQSLYTMRHKRFQGDFQQQQPIYRPPSQHQPSQQQQQQQQVYAAAFNQQAYYYAQSTLPYNISSNYRPPASTNITPQLRQIRPNSNSTQPANIPNQRPQNSRSHPQQQQQQQQPQPPFYASILPRQQFVQQPPTVTNTNNCSPPSTPSAVAPRYQAPNLPPPPTNAIRPSVPISTTPLNIAHKTLPFYRPLACVYEYFQVFRYDSYRKQFCSRNDFILSLDVCNQLALSHYYDPDLDIHKTSKCLIMRLIRIDQPPMSNGKYDDHLPPNIVIHVNSQNLTNLPTPKPCTRQQTDLVRVGREIDITSYCMFNPMLSNEIAMSWSYRPDNTNLHIQYLNAQFALHIFLVQHLTIEDLCDQIKNKPARFYREDLVKLLAKAIATDRDLGLEVSDQKLKLKCPIDQRRLKLPVRAVTCQHIQCFDLRNYIVLNEKAGKWICPVCNKPALFDDLQIDSYTESILNSIENENITEISIDSNLQWKPVISSSLIIEQQQITSNMNDIILDDDQNGRTHREIDSKANIQLIHSLRNGSNDVILIDDD